MTIDARETGPMPVFVINLDRSTDRLAHVSRQLTAQGVDFERIAAADGNAASEAAYQAFMAARPRSPGLTWRRGQMGCFLSHVDAWTRIAAGSAARAMVLEDDIRLSPELGRYVRADDWIPDGADIVRIETTGQWLKLSDRTRAGDRQVAGVRSPAWATGGYVIARDAAVRLLASDPRSHMPVDAFMFDTTRSEAARGLTTLQLLPALVTQDKFDSALGAGNLFASEIEGDNPKQDARWRRIRRSITSRLTGKTEIGFR